MIRSGRARYLPSLTLLALLACESPAPAPERSEELNSRLLQQLIESNALDPVDDSEFSEEDFYAALEKIYADRPRQRDELQEVERAASAGEEEAPQPPVKEAAPALAPNPYVEFGSDIVPYDDDGDGFHDRLMKPYAFPEGFGKRVVNLMRIYGDFDVFAELENGLPELESVQPADSVVLDLHPGSMTEVWSDPRTPALTPGQPIALGDILYVTASTRTMRDVEHFIRRFGGSGVRQIEIEAKIVEVTTTDALDFGIRGVGAGTPIFGLPDNTFVDSFDYGFPNLATAGEALLQLSSVHDGLTLNAVLEAVASHENVSIISRPKVAVREGGRAEIVNISQIPYYNIGQINPTGGYSATLEYKDAGIKLYVIPRVVGTDTIDLNIDIEASQETGTAIAFASGDDNTVLSNPILTTRSAKTTVYLEPGQAVILGGLISERTVEAEKKVPLLGDLPLLGNLFKSRLNRKEQTNVLFFIRPRILEGSDLRRSFE